MPLRLLVRRWPSTRLGRGRRLSLLAPLVLGAVALAVWLRRRRRRAAVPAPVEPAPPPPPPRRQSTRFVRASEQRPVDIVTVVDDLLGVPG